jgi:hypothetical protein
MKSTIVFFIIIFIVYNAVSQTKDSSFKSIIEQKEKLINTNFDYNISLTQGFSYNHNQTNFHYINLDIGLKFFKKHELGICIGDNDMIWYGGYYRINFEENINIGLKIAKIDSHINYLVLNEITFGRDLKVTNNFNFRLQIFLSVKSKYPLGIKNESHYNKAGLLFGINYLL